MPKASLFLSRELTSRRLCSSCDIIPVTALRSLAELQPRPMAVPWFPVCHRLLLLPASQGSLHLRLALVLAPQGAARGHPWLRLRRPHVCLGWSKHQLLLMSSRPHCHAGSSQRAQPSQRACPCSQPWPCQSPCSCLEACPCHLLVLKLLLRRLLQGSQGSPSSLARQAARGAMLQAQPQLWALLVGGGTGAGPMAQQGNITVQLALVGKQLIPGGAVPQAKRGQCLPLQAAEPQVCSQGRDSRLGIRLHTHTGSGLSLQANIGELLGPTST